MEDDSKLSIASDPTKMAAEDSDRSTSVDKEKGQPEVSIMAAASPLRSVVSPSGKVIELGEEKDLDEAMALAEKVGHAEVSPSEDTKLRWKIDMIVMPIFGGLQMFSFCDKTCMTYTAVMGLRRDYNILHGQGFSWLTSAFYIGYMFGNIFSANLLQKLPTMKTVAVFTVLWGVVQCCHAAAPNYPVLCFLRTLLGVLEAFITPVFVIVLNQYYRHTEHFGRMGIFYGTNGLGTIFMSGVAYGLYKYEESYSMEAYKILFILIGLITILLGALVLVLMPDTPAGARWLSDREKVVVLERIRDNNQGWGSKEFKWNQVKEFATDIKTYLYFLMTVSVGIPNSGISSFGTLILTGMGYRNVQALLMRMPVGCFELVGLAGLPFFSRFCKSRMRLAIGFMSFVFIGVCMLAFATHDRYAQLVGYYIYGMSPVGIILITSCVSSNTAGHTKKLLTNALTLIGYGAGNTVGPQLFRSSDAPHYHHATTADVILVIISIALMAIIYYISARDNRKREQHKEEMGDAYVVPDNLEFADLTDKENPEFRYRI